MRTKRKIAHELLSLLKAAYANIDCVPYEEDPARSAVAIGRYDGLKQAYVILTGRSPQDISNEVTTWYVGTPEYQEAKKHYGESAS